MVVSFCARRLLLSRRKLFKIPTRKHGYTVLLPEIGEDMVKRNPLVKDNNTPEFNNATIEKCIAAILKQSIEIEERVKEIETSLKENQDLHIFDDVLNPIEELYMPLELTLGVAKTLFLGNQSLIPTKTYLKIDERAKKAFTMKFHSKEIYNACLRAKDNKKLQLTQEQSRVIDKYLLEGRLNGVPLVKRNLEIYYKNAGYLNQFIREYTEKLEASTRRYGLKIEDPKIVAPLPHDLLQKIATDPEKPYVGPWTVTLYPYVYNTFLEYCPDSSMRAQIWIGHTSRGSRSGDRAYRTSVCIEEIRSTRQDVSNILGFPTFLDMSMKTKMAESKQNVNAVFDTLLENAYPAQEKDFASLTEFRGTTDFWKEADLPYWIRQQRETLFPYDKENLHNYFPLRKVLSGLFQLVENLYDLKIVESRKVDVWHKAVRYFEIFEADKTNEPISSFYVDPYSTDETSHIQNENGNTVTIRKRSKIANTTPMAALIFNFKKPVDKKPCLLSISDVETLFKKVGHVLPNLLTKGEHGDVCGLSFVEWDGAFISDYFMANWLYEPWVLKQVSGHYDTNKSLPDETINALRNIRTHFTAFDLCKRMYLSDLDLELHSKEDFWETLAIKLWKKYIVIPRPKYDERVLSFSEIFNGQWPAAYYSSLWSEMLAADAYNAFQEIPPTNTDQQKQTAKRYRETFLSLTGVYPTPEIFRRFRGRDPTPIALLNLLGISKVAPKDS